MTSKPAVIRLYGTGAKRLYLNQDERLRLQQIAQCRDEHIRNLCLTLLYTGCRLSEALNLTSAHLHPTEGLIAIESLKKRGQFHVRQVPVPPNFIRKLLPDNMKETSPLFPQSRTTAWRQITTLMKEAEICGPMATPKGLRHSFGVHCALNNIAMTLAQKWLGHASLQTTAIYYQIVGKEEREMAARLWD